MSKKLRGMNIEVKLEGLRELNEKFRRMYPSYGQAWRRGIHHAGMFLKREAMKRTPVDTGALKNSARYRSHGTGWKTFGTVSYHMDYAALVHETHKTKGKYLENAYRENRKEILRRIWTVLNSARK